MLAHGELMKVSKTSLLLLGIFIFALILRVITASHLDVSTDEMIYSIIPYNIISTAKLGTVDQSPLFFYLADITYKLSGALTPLKIRLLSVFFGALATIVVFLVSLQLFKNKKAALVSSFLFAASGYSLVHNVEMDMIAFFFALLSMYLFNLALNGDKKAYYLASAAFALSVLIKNITLIFLPVFILAYAIKYKNKDTHLSLTSDLKPIILSVFIFLALVSPVLIYNYVLYSEKGIADFYFADFIGEEAVPIKGTGEFGWHFDEFKGTIVSKIKEMVKLDPVLLFSGVLGVLAVAWKKRESLHFSISLLVLFFYVGGKTASSSHYLWVPLILSIFAGYVIVELSDWIKVFHRSASRFLIVAVIAFAAFGSYSALSEAKASGEDSLTVQLRDYARSIPDNSLVVIDPRIYNGIHAWVFHDKHYLAGNYAPQFFEQLNQAQGQMTKVPLYYLECSNTTGKYCGWKPEDYARVSEFGQRLTAEFSKNTEITAEVGIRDVVIIHRGEISIPAALLNSVDQTHQFWGYPVGWKYPEQAIDYVQLKGFSSFLYAIGLIMLWINVILVFLSVPLLFILLKAKRYE